MTLQKDHPLYESVKLVLNSAYKNVYRAANTGMVTAYWQIGRLIVEEEKIKQPDDNPTIGIILCSQHNESVIKYSVLAENKQLFSSKYKLYLPTEEELKDEIERDRIHIENELREQIIKYQTNH